MSLGPCPWSVGGENRGKGLYGCSCLDMEGGREAGAVIGVARDGERMELGQRDLRAGDGED